MAGAAGADTAAKIVAAGARIDEDFHSGDPARIAAKLTQDAASRSPDVIFASGREATGRMFQAILKFAFGRKASTTVAWDIVYDDVVIEAFRAVVSQAKKSVEMQQQIG